MADGKTRSRPRNSLLILAAALGALFGLACVFLIWAFLIRDALPHLSEEDFQQAQRRWREQGPANYDIEVEVSGRQPAVYRVEVRDGAPTAAFRNGRPLPQRRTWETWSVPGMFDTLASDFQSVRRLASGQADENTPRVSLYGVFDPHYGYPAQYRRVMLGQGREESMAHRIGQGATASAGVSALETSWVVRNFAVRDSLK